MSTFLLKKRVKLFYVVFPLHSLAPSGITVCMRQYTYPTIYLVWKAMPVDLHKRPFGLDNVFSQIFGENLGGQKVGFLGEAKKYQNFGLISGLKRTWTASRTPCNAVNTNWSSFRCPVTIVTTFFWGWPQKNWFRAKEQRYWAQKGHFGQWGPRNGLPNGQTAIYRKTEGIQSYLRIWGIIPHICHEPHEYIRVNFFWPV